ncbi:serine-rich protein [Blautia sp. 1033sp1_1033st1_G9_1033SCRN_220408]|uniref:serine-rich protein n=1 Tax=Blautia sp. 1033sp1_1033st1_G9_1033SCRN_220408 TaxID=3144490 RepID=UPI0034A0E632
MALLHRMKKVLNPVNTSIPEDDFRILDSWTESDKEINPSKAKMNYLCYKIETIDPETGKKSILYKAVKFARVDRLPKSAKQSTSFMDMQSQVLSAVYEQGYNLVTIIANVIKPTPEGLMYLYGVQGVSDNIDDAKARADSDFKGFIGSMMGTFRVLHMHAITAEEGAWLGEKMRTMKFMTAVRGIPKANTAGEDMGNKGVGGTNLNPDSQGTLEEIITAMADYEYVIEVLSTPVYHRTLMAWTAQTEKQMTEWYGQLQGTKSLSFNLSIPMTYMTSTGNSQGWSKNYTDSRTVSYTQGESYNTGYSESVGKSISHSLGESFGLSHGNSVTDSVGENHSISQGVTRGQTVGTTEGITRGQTIGQTIGHTQGVTRGYTQGITRGESTGVSMSQASGNSLGNSFGSSRGISLGQNNSESMSQSYSSGVSRNHSDGVSNSTNIGQSYSQSVSQSANKSFGESSNISHSTGVNSSDSYGTSTSQGIGGSHNTSNGYSNSNSWSNGWSNTSSDSTGYSGNHSHSESNSDSVGGNAGVNVLGVSAGVNGSQSGGTSDTTGSGFNNSHSNSSGTSGSNGKSFGTSHSSSDGSSWNMGAGTSQSHSAGLSESYSAGMGKSYSEGFGSSYGTSQGLSYSNGQGTSSSDSIGQSSSTSSGYGSSKGSSYGESASNSSSQNVGQSYSVSISQNKGTSLSSSMSQSVSQSESISQSLSQSDSLSRSYSQSNSESVSQSQSVSDGTSKSRSVGQSDSESYTQSVSNGTGQNWGQSSSVGKGQSYGSSEGKSSGTSIGSTGSFTTGTSGSLGLGPSIGYSKSYQWLDQQVKDILELLEYQNERLKKALRGNGAFYTYVYIACPDMDALSVAQASAKSTWQNEYAMTQPIQILDLCDEEQQHLLYHFRAFSADVTRENIAGVSDYKYATVLLPNEYVAYAHLPRVSEGGIDTNIDDVPKFRVPGLLRGNIYMGTQLNAERYTFKNGYRTQFDYRINIDELMHGVFTGASRSGKTVAAMRFIRELANSRRTATGKRLRIVIMDPKQDWRGIARFVEPERFRFYSMGNTHFRPINLNPCKIPYKVEPQHWIDGIINIYCRAYGLLERGKQMLSDVFYKLYTQAGVFPSKGEFFDEEYMNNKDNYKFPEVYPDWDAEISRRSASVTFHKIYKDMQQTSDSFNGGQKRAGNDTLDAYSRLLERLSCFARPYSIEYRLFSAEDNFSDPNSKGTGLGVDELIGEDDVTVFESFGLESTFANFIFGIITSGFYKVAKGFERGYLNPAQYETVLVIEEANKVLTGNDTAGTGGGGGMASLSGQSEFEEILDQSAGYGLFIIAITQKISMMPSSIVANCGMFFLGKISQPEDVDLAVRMIGREGRIDDRDVVKWLPKSPTGWFICRSNRGYDFRDAEPVLVQIEPLNNATISNSELEEILTKKEISAVFQKAAG